jgi:hypothetical protein
MSPIDDPAEQNSPGAGSCQNLQCRAEIANPAQSDPVPAKVNRDIQRRRYDADAIAKDLGCDEDRVHDAYPFDELMFIPPGPEQCRSANPSLCRNDERTVAGPTAVMNFFYVSA